MKIEKKQEQHTEAAHTALPSTRFASNASSISLARALALCAFAVSNVAFAQGRQIGGGLITYSQPIILFLGVGAVIVALVGSVFRPELVKGAFYAAVILVVVFFILRNTAALQSAVQAG